MPLETQQSVSVLSKIEPEVCASTLNPLLSGPLRESPPVPGTQAGSVAIGRVVAVDADGPTVSLPGLGEQRARALCVLPEDWAERQCAVLFENGDLTRPLIVGLLVLEVTTPESQQPDAISANADRELLVDGERVVIQADTELELRCGESVILLQRDGRIEIRGNYITSQATATQRLRGGSIHMN